MESKYSQKRGNKGSWRIPLLIVMVLLLVAALGLALWLPHVETAPPGTEPPPSAEGTRPPDTAETHPAEESQQPEVTEPGDTDQTEATERQENSGTKNQNNGSSSGSGSGTAVVKPEKPVFAEDSGIVCKQYSLFSGQFVEDGRDELVSNVASILVTNNTERFLDLATITYDIDGETATFIVTGLPAGRSAWVMETDRMLASSSSVFTYLDIATSFRDGVAATAEDITITADGNMLTATNNTDETREGVFIYYRTLHTDGNFFGGITYLVDFGTLEPGGSVTKMGGHFSEDSEIVRIGWS